MGKGPGPKIQCNRCKTVLQSLHRHDMQCCSCVGTFHEECDKLRYLRDEGKTVEYWDAVNALTKGICIDGGGEYTKLAGDLHNYTYVEGGDNGR